MDHVGGPDLVAQILIDRATSCRRFAVEPQSGGRNKLEAVQLPEQLRRFSIGNPHPVAQIEGHGFCDRPDGGVQKLALASLNNRTMAPHAQCLPMQIAGHQGLGPDDDIFLNVLRAFLHRRQEVGLAMGADRRSRHMNGPINTVRLGPETSKKTVAGLLPRCVM